MATFLLSFSSCRVASRSSRAAGAARLAASSCSRTVRRGAMPLSALSPSVDSPGHVLFPPLLLARSVSASCSAFTLVRRSSFARCSSGRKVSGSWAVRALLNGMASLRLLPRACRLAALVAPFGRSLSAGFGEPLSCRVALRLPGSGGPVPLGANPAVKGTAEKLRFSVPSALRAPAAPYLER
jgi:hypothetical protein